MKINRLKFDNYRNLENDIIYPCEGVNIFYGDNAQGKTNILESIWLFTGGRSFRGAKDKELINFAEDCAQLEIDFFSREREQNAVINIKNNKRFAILNDVEKKSTHELIGSFCAVVFSPVHLSIIKEGPNGRRKFIDAALCQIKPSYVSLLSRYNRTLLQRNTLIKDIKYHAELIETIDIWDSKLAKYGALIIKNRLDYLEDLSKISKRVYSGISDGQENFDIIYKPSFKSKITVDNIENVLLSEYKKTLNEDIKSGFTNIGPHRDDFSIYIDGKSARSYASQGQQRSCVLTLKLAEAELLKMYIDEKPVILLDDVMSELDNKRQDYILNSIKGFQVFVTCCEPSAVLRLIQGKKFKIKNGKVISQKG